MISPEMKFSLCKLAKCLWRYTLAVIIIVFVTMQGKVGYHHQTHEPQVPDIINTTAQGRRFAAFSALKEFTSPNFSRLINVTEIKNNTTEIQLIPHIIHQIWDSDEIPKEFKKWVATWTKFQPKWEYWFWTHKEFRQLLEIVDPAFLKDYDSYKSGQARADVMRFYIMYYFGGVYADLDIQVLQSLDYWTYRNHCILPEETYAHPFILNNFTHSPAMIGLLLCRPGHPYFKLAINHMQEYTTRGYGKKLLFVDDVYRAYLQDKETWNRPENRIYLAPPKYFLPTWDPGNYSTLKYRCTSEQYMSKMTKKQKEVCYTLHKERWINRPKRQSFTNHHWVHVIMHEEDWKEKTSVPIQKIIPKTMFKNVTAVITNLKSRVNLTDTFWQESRKKHTQKL